MCIISCFQITRAFILIVIIDQSLLSRVEAESNPKQRAVWQGPAVALCLPSLLCSPPPRRNIGKHAGAHGCEFLMVHALSGFCSAQSKFLCDVCQEYRSQKTLRKPPASLGQGKMLLMDDFDSVVLPPKKAKQFGHWRVDDIHFHSNARTCSNPKHGCLTNQFVSLLKLIFIDL